MRIENYVEDPKARWLYIIIADPTTLPMVPTKPGVPFKVGLSNRPRKRLSQVQTGCPFRLELKYWNELPADCCGPASEFEKSVHNRLAHIAVGGEWFFGDPDEAYAVARDVYQEAGDLAWEEYQRSIA